MPGPSGLEHRCFDGLLKAIRRSLVSHAISINLNRVKHVANKSKSFKEAEEWDRQQQREMTPSERIAVVRELQRRVYGADAPDVREWHRRTK